MTFTWKHPKYYEELRRRRREESTSHQAQAIDETVPYNDIEEAQASSDKRQAPEQTSHEDS